MPEEESNVEIELQVTSNNNQEPLNVDNVEQVDTEGVKDVEDPKKDGEKKDKEDVKEDDSNHICKFDAIYIEAKLYDIDKDLGGNIAEYEKMVRKYDKFYLQSDELKTKVTEIKKKQDERKTFRHKNEAKDKELTVEIKNDLKYLDEAIKDSSEILRKQYTNTENPRSTEEMDIKEKMQIQWRDAYDKLFSIEKKVVEITHVERETQDIEMQGDLMEEQQSSASKLHYRQGEMTELEKEGMKRLEQGEKEVDEYVGQINDGVDKLLIGIDDTHGLLKDQEGIIKKVEVEVDELTGELLTEATKLKKTLAKWKSAGSATIMVILIILLCCTIGGLVITIKACF